jgi:hypothetical protein
VFSNVFRFQEVVVVSLGVLSVRGGIIQDPVSVHDKLQTEGFLLAIWLMFDRESERQQGKMGGRLAWEMGWEGKRGERPDQWDVLKVQVRLM